MGVSEWRLREINIELISDNEKVEVICGSQRQALKQLKKGSRWLSHDKHTDSLCDLRWDWGTGNPKVVFQKAEITLIDPVNLSR